MYETSESLHGIFHTMPFCAFGGVLFLGLEIKMPSSVEACTRFEWQGVGVSPPLPRLLCDHKIICALKWGFANQNRGFRSNGKWKIKKRTFVPLLSNTACVLCIRIVLVDWNTKKNNGHAPKCAHTLKRPDTEQSVNRNFRTPRRLCTKHSTLKQPSPKRPRPDQGLREAILIYEKNLILPTAYVHWGDGNWC